MPSKKKSNLDKELEKARRDLENNPPLSRKDYEEAIKALAQKWNMTVEELERSLDESVQEVQGAAEMIRELWEKGLPPRVEKELKKSKALYPTSECLQPHELNSLVGNRVRLRHVLGCKFCLGLVRWPPGQKPSAAKKKGKR